MRDHHGGTGEVMEGRVLNRIVRWTPQGFEMEADPRHAKMIVEAMGLSGAKGVASPGEAEKKREAEENKELLPTGQATLFRSVAALPAQVRPENNNNIWNFSIPLLVDISYTTFLCVPLHTSGAG